MRQRLQEAGRASRAMHKGGEGGGAQQLTYGHLGLCVVTRRHAGRRVPGREVLASAQQYNRDAFNIGHVGLERLQIESFCTVSGV
jgi:hypothetical protein